METTFDVKVHTIGGRDISLNGVEEAMVNHFKMWLYGQVKSDTFEYMSPDGETVLIRRGVVELVRISESQYM